MTAHSKAEGYDKNGVLSRNCQPLDTPTRRVGYGARRRPQAKCPSVIILSGTASSSHGTTHAPAAATPQAGDLGLSVEILADGEPSALAELGFRSRNEVYVEILADCEPSALGLLA